MGFILPIKLPSLVEFEKARRAFYRAPKFAVKRFLTIFTMLLPTNARPSGTPPRHGPRKKKEIAFGYKYYPRRNGYEILFLGCYKLSKQPKFPVS